MDLSSEDLQHLSAAQGYIGLKMYLEANDELERVSPENRTHPQVIMLRVEIYRCLEKWELMQVVAKRMTVEDPDDPQWWISWAYATRRAQSIDAARTILVNALESHPNVAGFHFNLACYECQIGDLQVPGKGYARRFELDGRLRLDALDDPDLMQIRDSI